MDKLVEDLILRIEMQKQKDETLINDNHVKNDTSLVLLNAGKIIAYDYCISELNRLIEFYKKSKMN